MSFYELNHVYFNFKNIMEGESKIFLNKIMISWNVTEFKKVSLFQEIINKIYRKCTLTLYDVYSNLTSYIGFI